MNAVFNQNFIEIYEQAEWKFFEAQISDDLRGVNRQQLIHSLQFHQKFFFHDQVCPKPDLNANSFVIQRDRQLNLMIYTSQPQFLAQARFVSRFQ